MKEKYQKAFEVLSKALKEVDDILKGTPLYLIVITSLTKIVNRLSRHTSNSLVSNNSEKKSKPLTKIMGQAIPQRKVNDTVPSVELSDKELFKEKVEAYFLEFPTLSTESIFNRLIGPLDAAVLRGVAKKAGVQDFETHDINVSFVEKIQKGIKALSDLDEQELEIEQQLKEELENISKQVDEQSDLDEDDIEEKLIKELEQQTKKSAPKKGK